MKRKVWQTLAVTSFLYFASAAPGYAEELPLPTSAEDVAAAIQDIASTVAAVPEAPPLPTVVPTVPTPTADAPEPTPSTAQTATESQYQPPTTQYQPSSDRGREHARGARVDCLGRDTGHHAGDHGRRAAGGAGDHRYL